jgi:hypothetical protein
MCGTQIDLIDSVSISAFLSRKKHTKKSVFWSGENQKMKYTQYETYRFSLGSRAPRFLLHRLPFTNRYVRILRTNARLQGQWQLGAPLQRVAAVMLRELKLEFTPSNNPKQLQEPRTS